MLSGHARYSLFHPNADFPSDFEPTRADRDDQAKRPKICMRMLYSPPPLPPHRRPCDLLLPALAAKPGTSFPFRTGGEIDPILGERGWGGTWGESRGESRGWSRSRTLLHIEFDGYSICCS